MTDESLVMHWLSRAEIAMKTISYAQNHEDILLARALPHRDGFYIDVGANHPIFHSVTKLFADRGWTGINIEPSPPVFERLKADRPGDINLNVGVGDHADTLTFYETPDRHGWSSFRPELAAHYRSLEIEVIERPVPVRTLAEICAEHVGERTIDFLKIDAEGFERHVLLGANLATWRPRVLLIEDAWSEAWESLILEANYLPAISDGLNRFYVRAEDAALLTSFQSTANALDNFVPYELVRLIRQLEEDVRGLKQDLAVKTSLIEKLKVDAPRVARRLRLMAERLGLRNAS